MLTSGRRGERLVESGAVERRALEHDRRSRTRRGSRRAARSDVDPRRRRAARGRAPASGRDSRSRPPCRALRSRRARPSSEPMASPSGLAWLVSRKRRGWPDAARSGSQESSRFRCASFVEKLGRSRWLYSAPRSSSKSSSGVTRSLQSAARAGVRRKPLACSSASIVCWRVCLVAEHRDHDAGVAEVAGDLDARDGGQRDPRIAHLAQQQHRQLACGAVVDAIGSLAHSPSSRICGSQPRTTASPLLVGEPAAPRRESARTCAALDRDHRDADLGPLLQVVEAGLGGRDPDSALCRRSTRLRTTRRFALRSWTWGSWRSSIPRPTYMRSESAIRVRDRVRTGAAAGRRAACRLALPPSSESARSLP